MNSYSMKASAALLVAVAMVGCASPVTKDGKYQGLINSDPSKATIYVYRDRSFAGAANQYDVLVNGTLVGSLSNGSFFAVPTEAGEKIVKADTGSLGKGSTLTIEKGKTYCMKLTLNFCFSCKSADINPVDRAQCEKEIKSLTKVRLK